MRAPNAAPEREAEIRSWHAHHGNDPTDRSWCSECDLIAMLDIARAEAAKLKAATLRECHACWSWRETDGNRNFMHSCKASKDLKQVEDDKQALAQQLATVTKERDEAVEAHRREKAEHERTIQRFHWGD